MTQVKVQQELLRMIISGYKHEKDKHLSKTKMRKMHLIWKQFAVCELHKRFCISADVFYFVCLIFHIA